jgi:hypothetical protein
MCAAREAQATQFAANVLPIIRDIQAAGHTSFNAIAGQLNARKVATANGGLPPCVRCLAQSLHGDFSRNMDCATA